MEKAEVWVHGILAGILEENDKKSFIFTYKDKYEGPPVSLTMPLTEKIYRFENFPPFFEGLLPEGAQLEALLRREKIDQRDYFKQLITVGSDMVGAVTVRRCK